MFLATHLNDRTVGRLLRVLPHMKAWKCQDSTTFVSRYVSQIEGDTTKTMVTACGIPRQAFDVDAFRYPAALIWRTRVYTKIKISSHFFLIIFSSLFYFFMISSICFFRTSYILFIYNICSRKNRSRSFFKKRKCQKKTVAM